MRWAHSASSLPSAPVWVEGHLETQGNFLAWGRLTALYQRSRLTFKTTARWSFTSPTQGWEETQGRSILLPFGLLQIREG
jgi:hypothetical protein